MSLRFLFTLQQNVTQILVAMILIITGFKVKTNYLWTIAQLYGNKIIYLLYLFIIYNDGKELMAKRQNLWENSIS